jgi:alanyl-tRNA synthetase
MTTRLYYADAYLKTFTARVVEQLTHDGRPAVILDQSALYPEGGGQPGDRGWLDQVEVVDVVERAHTILHLLSEPLPHDEVTGRIDWPRRFDHMQQHTGQHILSQAFIHVLGAETVAFHMSEGIDAGVTIDLNKMSLQSRRVDEVEDLANRVVFENRLVSAQIVTSAELATIPLRRPPKVDQSIRIVEIDDFDGSACGGTHVARTGEIGLIKINKLERRGAETRVEFRCGKRALADYRRKNEMINRVAADWSVGFGELDQAAARFTAENKLLRKQVEDVQARIMDFELAEVTANLRVYGSYAVAARVWHERDMATLRRAAKQVIARPGTVVLFGSGGEHPALVFARSSDLAFDMNALIRGAVATLHGKGGGAPEFAQAGGPAASDEQVQAAIEWAYHQLGV